MRFVPTIQYRPLLIASLSSGGFQRELITCTVSSVTCVKPPAPRYCFSFPLFNDGPCYFWFRSPGMCKHGSGSELKPFGLPSSSPTASHLGFFAAGAAFVGQLQAAF